MFSAFDKDGSGVIDFDEFLLALRVSSNMKSISTLHLYLLLLQLATTRTEPVGTKSTNHNINWEQRIATFFSNGPTTFKNANNK